MSLNLKISSQRGDTIVEVLIAMSVIGIVLASSYAIANRSLAVGRSAQERTEANKIAETQVERLRNESSQIDTPIFSTINDGEPFCIADDGSVQEFAPGFVILPIDQATEDLTTYPSTCRFGTSQRYSSSIIKNGNTFSVRVRYDRNTGSGVDEVMFSYRTYPFTSNLSLDIAQVFHRDKWGFINIKTEKSS